MIIKTLSNYFPNKKWQFQTLDNICYVRLDILAILKMCMSCGKSKLKSVILPCPNSFKKFC